MRVLRPFSSFPTCATLIVVSLTVLALAPLAGTLEIQHVLASDGADQGTHSESDLCAWIAVHVSGTPACRPAHDTFLLRFLHNADAAVSVLAQRHVPSLTPARAPPRFRLHPD